MQYKQQPQTGSGLVYRVMMWPGALSCGSCASHCLDKGRRLSHALCDLCQEQDIGTRSGPLHTPPSTPGIEAQTNMVRKTCRNSMVESFWGFPEGGDSQNRFCGRVVRESVKTFLGSITQQVDCCSITPIKPAAYTISAVPQTP